jgi:hypothetical protein
LQTATEEQRATGLGGVTGKGFQPGQSGNPGGRQKGTPNKATREVRELARRLVEDPEYQLKLKARLDAGQASALELLLWHYAYGKPKEAVELTAIGTSPSERRSSSCAGRTGGAPGADSDGISSRILLMRASNAQ